MALIPDYEFIAYIDSLGSKYKETDDELIFEKCPYCGAKDWKFQFSRSKQVFFCRHKNSCGVQGNLYRFKMDRGHLDQGTVTKARQISYTRPAEDKAITDNTGDFYGWYHKERGISPEILSRFGVGVHKEGSKRYIVYQFRDEAGKIVNRKYRNAVDKPDMRMEKGAEPFFYGVQLLDTASRTLYIVEGEDDCHALSQMGFKNVLSVPNGCKSAYTPRMDEVCKRFETIYLVFDNDPEGQAGARKLAEKIGLTKCRNVILPFKDARDCLLNGLGIEAIQKEVQRASIFRHEEIAKFADESSELKDYLSNSQKSIGKPIRIKGFNKVVGGIRMAEMSILIGHSGAGKSTLAYNFAVWAEEVGLVPMILSFENRLPAVKKKLIEICSAESVNEYNAFSGEWKLSKGEGWIESWINYLHEKNFYFLNKSKNSDNGYYDLERLGKLIEYANRFYDVNLFVVDHLHYFLHTANSRNPVQVIEEAIRTLKQWTERFGIHILLICHPHMTQDSKTGEPVKLGMNSPKGSSAIFQESDNFWVVERHDSQEGKARIRVLKNREGKSLGAVEFEVLENKNTYTEKGMGVLA